MMATSIEAGGGATLTPSYNNSGLHGESSIPAISPINGEQSNDSLKSNCSTPTGGSISPLNNISEGNINTLIALGQLQELDAAIQKNKDTRVDGRKLRWIEFRKNKSQETPEREQTDKPRKRGKSSTRKTIENAENDSNAVNFNLNNNNQNKNRNLEKKGTMKVEVVSPSDPAPSGKTNVLSSMKEQFLQGTNETTTTEKPDQSPSPIKKKVGRPKKKKVLTPLQNTPKEKEAAAPISIDISSNLIKGIDPSLMSAAINPALVNISLREIRKSDIKTEEDELSPTKSAPSPHEGTLATVPMNQNIPGDNPDDVAAAESTPVSGATSFDTLNGASNDGEEKENKKLIVINGLDSSTTDSDTDEKPVIDSNNSNVLNSRPKGSALQAFKESFKCPLIAHSARIMSQKSNKKEGKNLKGVLGSKISKKTSITRVNKKNVKSNDIQSTLDSITVVTKRGRGRGKGGQNRRPLVNSIEDSEASSKGPSKKTSTIVADVHNSMNGEPQTSISTKKKLNKNKKSAEVLENGTTVPSKGEIKNSSKNVSLTNNETNSSPLVPQKTPSVNNSEKNSPNINKPSASQANQIKSISGNNSTNKKSPSSSQLNATEGRKESLQDSLKQKTNPPRILKLNTVRNQNKSILKSNISIMNNSNSSLPEDESSVENMVGSNDSSLNQLAPEKNTENTSTNLSTNKFYTDKHRISNRLSPKKVVSNEANSTLPIETISLDTKETREGKEAHSSTSSKSSDTNKSMTDNNDVSSSVDEKPIIVLDEDEKDNSVNKSKTKSKTSRVLKQLLQDEGIRNMLKDFDGPTTNESDDASQHKLRPKRAVEPIASSPEPEELNHFPPKRKKRVTEVDNLYTDEGALNMLTSIDYQSRRAENNDDSSNDLSQSGSVKTTKVPKQPPKTIDITEEPVKRKANAVSTKQNITSEPKKIRTDTDLSDDIQEIKPIQNGLPKTSTSTSGDLKNKRLLLEIATALEHHGGVSEETMSELRNVLSKQKISVKHLDTSQGKNQVRKSFSNSSTHSLGAGGLGMLRLNKPQRPDSLPTMKPLENGHGLKADLLREGQVTSPIPMRKPPHIQASIKASNLTSPVSKTSLLSGARPKSRTGESLRQSQRSVLRQTEGYHFRDISLKRFHSFVHIIFNPSTTKMKNAINSRVLRELCDALTFLRKDEQAKMVLLTGTGTTFCQGIDVTALTHSNIDIRKKNAENLVRGMKEFFKLLVQFPKPIVAGVNGTAIGLGVTMLPLFDVVIASDKAEFFLPYGQLGQVPEGGATFTFPNSFGKLQSNRLFHGQKITAQEALQVGLVTEIIWPSTFLEVLIPKVAMRASQNVQSMEATKALMNHHLSTKLEISLESECRLLQQHWSSPQFSALSRTFLESNYIQLQKPVQGPFL